MTALAIAPARAAGACPSWCVYPGRPAGTAHVSRDVSVPLVVLGDERTTRTAPAGEIETWPRIIAELVERDDVPGGPVIETGIFCVGDGETFLTLDGAERFARGVLALVEAARNGGVR